MRQLKKRALIFLLLLITILSASCDDSVVIQNLDVKSDFYEEHGYFLGNTEVEFEIELANERDDLVYYWQADGGRVLNQGESSVVYLTPKLPGNYNLQLEIREGQETLTTFNYSFVVEGDYPAEVALTKAENRLRQTGVELEWSKYEEEDFYGYKILRSNNFYIDDQAEVITSIEDQQETSYVDLEVEAGEMYTYQIMVTNERGYVSASNEKSLSVLPEGREKINIGEELSEIKLNSDRGVGYIGNRAEQKIMTIDLNTNELKDEIKLDFSPEELNMIDNRRLLVLGDRGNSMAKIDLVNFEVTTYDLETRVKDLAVKQDQVYLLTKGQNNLFSLSLDNGEIVKKPDLKRRDKVISGNKLEFISDEVLLVDEVFGPLLVYDLKDLASPKETVELGALEKLITQQVDGKNLIYLSTAKERSIQLYQLMDSGKLNKVGNYNSEFFPTDFTLSFEKDLLFASYEAKEVPIFSLDNRNRWGKLDFDNYVFDLEVDKSGEKLYLLTADIGQTDYNVVVEDLNLINN